MFSSLCFLPCSACCEYEGADVRFQIAEAYLYCVRADYANGTLITIDGGESCRTFLDL